MKSDGGEQVTCVLGAGSTAQVSDEINNGLQVPTDKDFFASAHSVLSKEKKFSTDDFDTLLKWLQEMFPPTSSTAGFSDLPGLEEVMTILDLRTQDRPEQGTQYR